MRHNASKMRRKETVLKSDISFSPKMWVQLHIQYTYLHLAVWCTVSWQFEKCLIFLDKKFPSFPQKSQSFFSWSTFLFAKKDVDVIESVLFSMLFSLCMMVALEWVADWISNFDCLSEIHPFLSMISNLPSEVLAIIASSNQSLFMRNAIFNHNQFIEE